MPAKEVSNLIPSIKSKARRDQIRIAGKIFPRFFDELWTSRQRQNNPVHEISYRACFKAELPRFFIMNFTEPGDVVYDPFAGRGTTLIEAALLERNFISNDINPLSRILSEPRLFIPDYTEVEERLSQIRFKKNLKADIDISMFYHPETESEIVSLKNYLTDRKNAGVEDRVDAWIRMVATNRLTGHSKNFFSVYTLPPNQAVTPERQARINRLRNQKPEYKDVKRIILKKTRDLMKGISRDIKKQLESIGNKGKFLTEDARDTNEIKSNSVVLTVTSPPFLDVINYKEDNWLRCWFNNIDAEKIAGKITTVKTLSGWESVMRDVFKELYRITRKNGRIAFEVGEIRKAQINLDEHVVPLGISAGFICEGILINLQNFTKTANIWGIKNNRFGTNTNRIVLFKKISD